VANTTAARAAGSAVACGGVRTVFMLERKPFASIASVSLMDASGGPFVTIKHSLIDLGSVACVACEA
jgi:hypothetical protein